MDAAAEKLKMRARIVVVLLAWLVVPPGLPRAAEVEGLYEAEVQVEGQGKEERSEAIRAVLAEVAMKVTGRRGVAGLPGLAPAFKRAEQMMQQYRYRPLPEEMARVIPVISPAQAAAKGVQRQVLWASFDPSAVNQALRQAGLPVWGRVRPAVLVLLALEEPAQKSVLLADSRPELQPILENRARRRGVPMLLPQDAEAEGVRFPDIWNGARDALLKAAARERADAVLAGRLTQRAGAWRVRWTLYQGNSVDAWESGGAPHDVLEAGVDGAADALAKRFAEVLSDVAGAVLITVADVATLDDYARAMNYLQSLDGVSEVGVVRLETGKITFRLMARGSGKGLAQTIALGKMLVNIPDEVSAPEVDQAPGATAVLRYRLRP